MTRQTRSVVVLALVTLTALGAAAQQQQPGPPPLPTEIPPLPHIDPALPTVFLIGDSTVKVGTEGQMGWGEAIEALFDRTRINVVNYARGGRSSRTFQTEGLWDRARAAMRKNDVALIQFGHNDAGELFLTTRPRASLPGVGEDTQEGTVALTGTHEVVHTFGWYLRKYIADTRDRGATPVICSLVPRNVWMDGKIVRDERAAWARAVAMSAKTPFLDLNEVIARRYEALGAEAVAGFFGTDRTHTNPAGARFSAEAVASALKDAQLPLASFLLAL